MLTPCSGGFGHDCGKSLQPHTHTHTHTHTQHTNRQTHTDRQTDKQTHTHTHTHTRTTTRNVPVAVHLVASWPGRALPDVLDWSTGRLLARKTGQGGSGGCRHAWKTKYAQEITAKETLDGTKTDMTL